MAHELQGLDIAAYPNLWDWLGRLKHFCDAIDRMRG